MTWILVALMMFNGELQARLLEHETQKSCAQMAQAISTQYPAATVACLPVPGQRS